MITVSVCMIVKNESQILARCLDSLKGIWDELIIVDTGSSDETVRIAKKYTDKVYDFEWCNDFSKARNFCIDKATCDYIYSADADEILEGDNYDKFIALKECLDTQIDVVQMYYGNQLDNGTVYNFDKELRPKLFKRVKPIRFVEPIHETLSIEPIIFDSDIVITHKPTSLHTSRDLSTFKRMIQAGEILSKRLQKFLDRELYLSEDTNELADFAGYLEEIVNDPDRSDEEILEACTILVRHCRLTGDYLKMFDNAIKVLAMESNSEVCSELGTYYFEHERYDDAAIWYFNAYHECTPIMNLNAGHKIPLLGLVETYKKLGNKEMEDYYTELANTPVSIE